LCNISFIYFSVCMFVLFQHTMYMPALCECRVLTKGYKTKLLRLEIYLRYCIFRVIYYWLVTFGKGSVTNLANILLLSSTYSLKTLLWTLPLVSLLKICPSFAVFKYAYNTSLVVVLVADLIFRWGHKVLRKCWVISYLQEIIFQTECIYLICKIVLKTKFLDNKFQI
jgi:hypothetical protein